MEERASRMLAVADRVDAQVCVELAEAAAEGDKNGYSRWEQVHKLQHPRGRARVEVRVG